MTGSDPHIIILLALFNGAHHLVQQLDSLAAQDHQNWSLLASDDGSTDASIEMIRDFAARQTAHQVQVVHRQSGGTKDLGQGAAENFRFLLGQIPDHAAFAALCDQDDVWLPDRLSRGKAALQTLPPDLPALWCSSVTICNEALTPLGQSRTLAVTPGLRHALVENMVQGNTVLLNRAAIRLIMAANADTGPIVMHDWWIYQLLTAAGGRVLYDPAPSVLYRQHDRNVVGARDGLRSRFQRLKHLYRDDFRQWMQINRAALEDARHFLTPDSRLVLDHFNRLQSPLPHRLIAMRSGGFHRQGRLAQLALWAAVLLRKC